MKKENGITLIALVITILVIIVLATIAINMAFGENGIITRAEEARDLSKISSITERAELARVGAIAEHGNDTTRDEIINQIIEEMGGSANGNLITTEDGEYEIMVKEDLTIEVVEKGEGYVDAEYQEPAPAEDFRWTELDDGTIRIYEYLGNETSLKIPDTIDGKVVTVIQRDSKIGTSEGMVEGGEISNNVIFKSVDIPNTVTIIGANSFDSSSIEQINLPTSLTTIGAYAFNGNKIKKLVIPDSVTQISHKAFLENEIEELKLSKNLKRIEMFTFRDNKIKSINIPEGVTFIGNRAFVNNQATEINIPNTVTTMKYAAFTQNNLEKIIYGRTETGEEDRTVINSYAGRNAGDVIIPNGVETVENWAFFDVGMTGLEIPESTQYVYMEAFYEQNNTMKKVVINADNKVLSISGGYSFKDIEVLEINTNNFTTTEGLQRIIYCSGNIGKMIVPASDDHSILNYYKDLVEKYRIYAKEIGSIVEKE